MASLFTHALAAASLGQAGRPGWRQDWRFWYAAVLCSILPDADILGFRMGVRYGDLWGHRGMTHSLLFAAAIAGIMAFRFRPAAGVSWNERWKLLLLFFAITASHGLLDAMTNGGLGVAFFSPFDRTRYFLPWTPVQVSPIGASGFFSGRGLEVIWSEIVWLWGPILLVGAVFYALQIWWNSKRLPKSP